MRTIVFAPETINIAETTRMVEIAKLCRQIYRCVFVGYSEEYAGIITDNGFEYLPLEPQLTREKTEHLWKVDRMESFKDPFTFQELDERVKSEIRILNETKASAVIMGFTLSFTISARVAGVPLICVMPFPLTEPFLKNNLAPVPDEIFRGIVKLIPDKWLRTLINKWFLSTTLWIKPFKRLSIQYNIKPLNRLVDIFQGDFNLITDIPELTGIKELPANWYYIGFIYAHLDEPIPEIISLIPKDKPLIYFAMGSSANRKILKQVIEAFSEINGYVICPMKKHLEQMKVIVPTNVYITDWLPAHLVNPMAKISVIHGGQGTVQTAVVSATPFIGIGLQPEQIANIEMMVNQGCARRIRKYEVSKKLLKAEIENLLNDQKAFSKAAEVARLAKSYNSKELILSKMKEIVK